MDKDQAARDREAARQRDRRRAVDLLRAYPTASDDDIMNWAGISIRKRIREAREIVAIVESGSDKFTLPKRVTES
jgi:hypothetical protein